MDGSAFSAISTCIKFVEFVSQLSDVTLEARVFCSLIDRVHQDLDEAVRLMTIPGIAEQLEKDIERKKYVESAILGAKRALINIGSFVEAVRVEEKLNGSIGLKSRFEWVLRHQSKLLTRERLLDTCHKSLLYAMTSMQVAETNSLQTNSLPPPYSAMDNAPGDDGDDEDDAILMGPYARKKMREIEREANLIDLEDDKRQSGKREILVDSQKDLNHPINDSVLYSHADLLLPVADGFHADKFLSRITDKVISRVQETSFSEDEKEMFTAGPFFPTELSSDSQAQISETRSKMGWEHLTELDSSEVTRGTTLGLDSADSPQNLSRTAGSQYRRQETPFTPYWYPRAGTVELDSDCLPPRSIADYSSAVKNHSTSSTPILPQHPQSGAPEEPQRASHSTNPSQFDSKTLSPFSPPVTSQYTYRPRESSFSSTLISPTDTTSDVVYNQRYPATQISKADLRHTSSYNNLSERAYSTLPEASFFQSQVVTDMTRDDSMLSSVQTLHPWCYRPSEWSQLPEVVVPLNTDRYYALQASQDSFPEVVTPSTLPRFESIGEISRNESLNKTAQVSVSAGEDKRERERAWRELALGDG